MSETAESIRELGIATGLAWTPVGGEVLFIEATRMPGKGNLLLTGSLGDVMKESAQTALSYLRSQSRTLGIDLADYAKHDIHIHVPAGATPKDGPSAGIALAAAIVSALTGTPVRGDVAMTGEITLRGRVLPIGGLKEKAVAAHRNHVTHVIIPAANVRDIEELPEDVRATVHFHPVKTMDEVLAIALRTLPVPAATPVSAARKRRGTGDSSRGDITVPPPVAH